MNGAKQASPVVRFGRYPPETKVAEVVAAAVSLASQAACVALVGRLQESLPSVWGHGPHPVLDWMAGASSGEASRHGQATKLAAEAVAPFY